MLSATLERRLSGREGRALPASPPPARDTDRDEELGQVRLSRELLQ